MSLAEGLFAMTYDELPKAIRDAVGVHEGLRRLGFSPDDIFVTCIPVREHIGIVLRTQGKEACIVIGACPGITDDKLASYWNDVGDALASGKLSNALFDRIYAESPAYTHGVQLMAAIIHAGFQPPNRFWGSQPKQKDNTQSLNFN